MGGKKVMNRPLKWDVFVSSQIPAVTSELPPGATEMKWSPISSTLISGERDAVLIDTFITMEQNRSLAEWAPQVERICPPSMRRMAMGTISSV
jgi:hypothetical protein